jgi:hypothetical protein
MARKRAVPEGTAAETKLMSAKIASKRFSPVD